MEVYRDCLIQKVKKMLQILVVDDNKFRVDLIKELAKNYKQQEIQITFATSIIEAKKVLFETLFDVMLLDLVLPLRDGSSPKDTGGADLLREMVQIDRYKLPHHVLVISEYENALKDLSSISNELAFSSIKYSASGEEWKIRLKNFLDQILRAESHSSIEYDYDFGIICALDNPELSEIKRLPYNWMPFAMVNDSTDYFIGTFAGKRIICASAYEMGMSASAILATKMILKFRPRYLIMTGIAGGVPGKGLRFGDVMIADPCFDYESGKRVFDGEESIFKPDYKPIRLDDKVCQIIKHIAARSDTLFRIYDSCCYEKPENTLQIKIGPLGSGAAVLSDPTVISRVLEHNRKFMGFDMEAYAVMLAGTIAPSPKPNTIVIKSVSDFGDGKTDKYQKYAAYTSAQVMDLFIKELTNKNIG